MLDALAQFVGAIIMAAVVFCAAIFVACVGGTFFGALGGWVVGWFFDDTLALAQRAFHIGAPPALGGDYSQPLQPWQLGAFLGFVGGFFKATLTTPSTKKKEA